MSLKHLVLALSAVTLAACSSDPSGPRIRFEPRTSDFRCCKRLSSAVTDRLSVSPCSTISFALP